MTYADKVHRFHRFNQRFMRIFMSVWMLVITTATICAAADAAWHFGWGYTWDDAKYGLIMVGLGILGWLGIEGMIVLVGGLNEIFFGPDPEQGQEPENQD